MSNLCYIGIGANLASPQQTVVKAFDALAKLPNSQLISKSSLYLSKPMGPQDQPDYVNAVVAIETQLEPLELLKHTQAIETEYGRTRGSEQWQARTLDLDILLYGQQRIEHPDLTVPHYGMKQREFVLYPLHEIAPSLQLPDGESLQHLIDSTPLNGMKTLTI